MWVWFSQGYKEAPNIGLYSGLDFSIAFDKWYSQTMNIFSGPEDIVRVFVFVLRLPSAIFNFSVLLPAALTPQIILHWSSCSQ